MRHSFLLALLVCTVGVQAILQKRDTSSAPRNTAARKIPCKTEGNASMCYWTHGRLSFYDGSPSWRIWKVGTNRVLGIYSIAAFTSTLPPNRGDSSEGPDFPASLEQVFDAESKFKHAAKPPDTSPLGPFFADFEVCPLEPERQGHMQAVCIESAKNIVVGK